MLSLYSVCSMSIFNAVVWQWRVVNQRVIWSVCIHWVVCLSSMLWLANHLYIVSEPWRGRKPTIKLPPHKWTKWIWQGHTLQGDTEVMAPKVIYFGMRSDAIQEGLACLTDGSISKCHMARSLWMPKTVSHNFHPPTLTQNSNVAQAPTFLMAS